VTDHFNYKMMTCMGSVMHNFAKKKYIVVILRSSSDHMYDRCNKDKKRIFLFLTALSNNDVSKKIFGTISKKGNVL